MPQLTTLLVGLLSPTLAKFSAADTKALHHLQDGGVLRQVDQVHTRLHELPAVG